MNSVQKFEDELSSFLNTCENYRLVKHVKDIPDFILEVLEAAERLHGLSITRLLSSFDQMVKEYYKYKADHEVMLLGSDEMIKQQVAILREKRDAKS